MTLGVPLCYVQVEQPKRLGSLYCNPRIVSCRGFRSLSWTLQTAVLVGMALAFYVLPRFCRLPLLIHGGFGQLTAMVLFTIISNLGPRTTQTTQGVAIAILYVFQFVNGVIWIWLPYLYRVEIVPTRYRGQAISIGNATFWLMAFVEVYAVPIALLLFKDQPASKSSPGFA